MSDEPRVAGLLLAAGAGRRMGMPKALVPGESGEPWVVRGARVLLDSGCSPVVVVIGARAEEVRQVLDDSFGDEPRLLVYRAEDWSDGLSASLRAGLGALASRGPDGAGVVEGVVVTLVDTPSLRVETVRRIRSTAVTANVGAPQALVQATFGDRPGHPVYLGRSHWGALTAQVHGDSGAGRYLRAHGAQQIDCSDLEHGDDVDTVRNTRI